MNPLTLRASLALLLAAGVVLLAAACGYEAPRESLLETSAPTAASLPADSAPTEPDRAVEAALASTVSQEAPERFLLTFAGDCTLGANPVNYYADVGFIKTVGEDYSYPFANVADYFEKDEFTMVNLEGALCDEGNPMEKKYTFRGPTAYIHILTGSSVEAVNLANNHSFDYGQRGYDSTLAALEEAGVAFVERDSTALITTENGLTIGLYGAVYYRLDVQDMTAEIASLKEQGADIVIYAPHWGVEGTYQPTQEQMRVGRAAIDAGADIVFGTHPHVLQPVEHYGGGVIFYSLGNFSFGGNSCPEDFDTALLQQEVIRRADGTVELGELTIVPACISSIPGRNNYQPTPYPPEDPGYQRVMDKLAGRWPEF